MISPAELLVVGDHVEACETCRRRLTDIEQLRAIITSLRADLDGEVITKTAHLSYEQLAAYANGHAGEMDREIVESHLEDCYECTAELQDLQGFKEELATYRQKEYAPARRTFIQGRPGTLLQRPALRITLQIATIAAVALLCAWTATLPLRKQVGDLNDRLNELREQNEALRAQVSTTEDLERRVAELQRAQVEVLSSSPQIALALNDDGVVALDRRGYLIGLEALPSSLRERLGSALSSGQITLPQEARDLAGKQGMLLGGSGEGVPFALISPVGKVIEAERPTLRWKPLSEATSYTVTISDSNFNEVARSADLRGTQWQVPHSLKRGGVYTWQVIAVKDGRQFKSPTPPAPDAKFKVLGQEEAEQIERAKDKYPNSHLLPGMLYSQAGLVDEAEREFEALVAANPNVPIARKLLTSLRAERSFR
jgi:anti-sigma factor RsiW